MPPIYRVKGLHDLSDRAKESETSDAPKAVVSKPSSPAILHQLDLAIGNPRLIDSLYHFDSTASLAELWPTFNYLQARPRFGPIKKAPLHLTSFIQGAIFPADDDLASDVRSVALQQSVEREALTELIRSTKTDANYNVDSTPLSLAIASSLLRGSSWMVDNKKEILKRILESPTAAFVALAGGAWSQNKFLLLAKIANSPDLVLELWRSAALRNSASEDWFLRALASHPTHRAIVLGEFQGKSEEAMVNLYKASLKNQQVAAICLGFDPSNENWPIWWKLARKNPESLYWTGRVWKAAGSAITSHPRYREILNHVKDCPCCRYHWARDIEPHSAEQFAREMWPSPWAIELIIDRRLSKEFLLDLIHASDLDEDAPWDSSILLWASEYVS